MLVLFLLGCGAVRRRYETMSKDDLQAPMSLHLQQPLPRAPVRRALRCLLGVAVTLALTACTSADPSPPDLSGDPDVEVGPLPEQLPTSSTEPDVPVTVAPTVAACELDVTAAGSVTTTWSTTDEATATFRTDHWLSDQQRFEALLRRLEAVAPVEGSEPTVDDATAPLDGWLVAECALPSGDSVVVRSAPASTFFDVPPVPSTYLASPEIEPSAPSELAVVATVGGRLFSPVAGSTVSVELGAGEGGVDLAMYLEEVEPLGDPAVLLVEGSITGTCGADYGRCG
jgi:hypothetical protein